MTEVVQQKIPDRKARYTLFAILLVSVLPLAAAYFMFFTGIGVPQNTVNAGTLVDKPLSIRSLLSEAQWQDMEENRKWRLLLPMSGSCDAKCDKHYYLTRQVHVRLGEKSVRLERIAINYGGKAGAAHLAAFAKNHPKLRAIDVEKEIWDEWFKHIPELLSLNDGHFYMLVDQEGMAMMVYAEQLGTELLTDIKRALKYSIDFQ